MLDFEDDDFYKPSIISHIPPQNTYTPIPYKRHYKDTYTPKYNQDSYNIERYNGSTKCNFFGNVWGDITYSYNEREKIMELIVKSLKEHTGHEYKFSSIPSDEFIDYLQMEDNGCATLLCPQLAPGCNELDYFEGSHIFMDIQKSNVCVIDFEINHELDNRFTFLLEDLRNELKEHIEHENKVLQKLEENGINDDTYESDIKIDELSIQNIHVEHNLFGNKLPEGYNSSYLTLEEYNVISREEYNTKTVSFKDEVETYRYEPQYLDEDEPEETYFSLSNIFPFSVLNSLY